MCLGQDLSALFRSPLRIGRFLPIAAGVLLLVAHNGARGQERGLSGSLAAGWSYGRAKSTFDEDRGNIFSMIRLDHENYLLDPRFFTFHVRPRFSTGFEDFYLGQFQGSGVEFDSTFLPESPWPIRFYYDRWRRLALAPGLGSIDSRSRTHMINSRIGVSGSYSVPGLPHFGFQFDKTAGAGEPEQALLQGFENRGRGFSLNGSDFRKSWKLEGFLRRQRYRDVIAFPGNGAVLRDTDTGATDGLFSAERNLGPNTTLLAQAIRSSGEVQFDTTRASHELSRVRGQLVHNPKKRLWASVLGDLGTTSARTRVAPSLVSDSNRPFAAFSVASGERNASSVLRYFLTPYLSVSGQGRLNQVSNPLIARAGTGQDPSGKAAGGGGSASAGPGIALNKGARYWSLSAGYDLNLSRVRIGSETARTVGHSAGGGVAAGDPSIVRGGATYQWSRRRVEGGLLLGVEEQSRSAAFDADKRAFRWMRVQGRWELARRRFDAWSLRSDNFSHGYRALLEVPRVQLSWSRQINSGSAWQSLFLPVAIEAPGAAAPARASVRDLAASGVPLMAHGQRIPAAAAALSALSATAAGRASDDRAVALGTIPLNFFTGSNASATSLTAAVAISSHASLHGTWQGQRQAVARLLPSRFEQHNAAFDWRFRMMTIEAVYQLIRYDFGTPVFRKQFMFRVTRDFRLF